MDRIELQYRLTTDDDSAEWRSIEPVPVTQSALRLGGLTAGKRYDIRVRSVVEELPSPWRSRLNHLVNPITRDVPAPQQVAAADANCLGWAQIDGLQAIAGYQVRHAPAVTPRIWDLLEPVTEARVPNSPASLCGVPKGERVFAVRAEDVHGNLSDPAWTTMDRGAFDERLATALWTEDHAALGWPGIFENGEKDGAELAALASVRYGPQSSSLYGTLDTDAYGAASGSPADPYGPTSEPLEQRYGADDSGTYGATEYADLVYVAKVHVPDVGELGPAQLSLAIGAQGAGWQVAFRCLAMPYGKDDRAPYGEDDAELYCPFEANWRPWPGRYERVPPGPYQFRVMVRGGSGQPRLTAVTAALSVA